MKRGVVAVLAMAALAAPLAAGTPKADAGALQWLRRAASRMGGALKRGWEDAKRFVKETTRRARRWVDKTARRVGDWVKKTAAGAAKVLKSAVSAGKRLLGKITVGGAQLGAMLKNSVGTRLALGARIQAAANSAGLRISTTRCGRLGQRACCVHERIPSCDPGYKEVPGCSGDCWCRIGILTTYSRGRCIPQVASPAKEPSTGWTGVPKTGTLTGYADIHMHLFAHLGFGGRVLAGKPYDKAGGVAAALAPCDKDGLHLVPHVISPVLGNASSLGDGTNDMHALCPDSGFDKGAHDAFCRTLLRTVDTASGWPSFTGWPTWHSTIHQQAYYKWLERAWRGGLRLMVQLAVTNEALCRGTRGKQRGEKCEDSMAYIDKQIEATEKLQEYIDDLHGGAGKGWFRIVKTPQEARQVILAGKLAVVQGIEVDNLFNCKLNRASCTPEFIRKQVAAYYDKGVRHVFPIHNFDNAFGGPATWQDAIEVGNKAVEGAWWTTRSCPQVAYSDGRPLQSYGFGLGRPENTMTSLLAFHLGFSVPDSFLKGVLTPLKKLWENVTRALPKHTESTSCNTNGLTEAGEALVEAMMDKGMIIDVDHMSRRSLRDTLVLAYGRDYPVVASHVQFFDLNQQGIRHERMRTRRQLEAIRHSGGMIGAMLKDDVLDTARIGKKLNLPYAEAVQNNCRHSSRSWAQMLQYAVDVMDGAVAMGSDFNGVAGHLGPRFGSDACGADLAEQAAQKHRLKYPFTLRDFGKFAKQKTGYRTFDFNADGLAHVGLYPDLIKDVEVVGLPKTYIDKLFESAEKYIQVWEKALRAPRGPAAKNLALLRPATQNATAYGGGAIRAVDGLRDGVYEHQSVTHTPNGRGNWWQVDLEGEHFVSEIRIYNRTDCCSDRLRAFQVRLLDTGGNSVWYAERMTPVGRKASFPVNKRGRYVRVTKMQGGYLSLAEVEVLGRQPQRRLAHSAPRRRRSLAGAPRRQPRMQWSSVRGSLVRISVGSAGHIWGVNAAGNVFRRVGSNWQSVRFPGKAADIGVGGDGAVWGVSVKDEISRLVSWGNGQPVWRSVPGHLARIAVGSARRVWGVNRAGEVFRWTGSTWTLLPGRLAEIGVGADGTVWGVSSAGVVWRWTGSGWSRTKGTLAGIAVGSAQNIWGVSRSGKVSRWTGSGWREVPGGLTEIGVGADGSVWGTNAAHRIWRLTR